LKKILNETKSKVLWLVDCVQALGKMELNLGRTRIDYAPFSGHKLYAPKGIGFLYVREGAPFSPLIVGGGQEKGKRSGTENLPGVAALGSVLNKLLDQNSEFQSHKTLMKYRERIVSVLRESFPRVLFNTPFEQSVPTTINFSVPGFKSSELLDVFDSAGLRVSAGSACSSGAAQSSPVLDAMGYPGWRSASALRLSFGPCTSAQEIEAGCRLIQESAVVLKNNCLLDCPVFEGPLHADLKAGVIQLIAGHLNSWIIVDEINRSCIVIDLVEPVSERIENLIRCQGLKVLAVLNTHSGAGWPGNEPERRVFLEDQSQARAIPLHASESDAWVLAELPMSDNPRDGVTYLVGEVVGECVLKSERVDFVFCSDTVIRGLGQTNFDQSLKRLSSCIHPRSILCPSHDYEECYVTHLQAERARNSFLNEDLSGSITRSLKEIKEMLKQHQGQEVLVVDVREAPEHLLFKNWESLGFQVAPINVPISRFANFARDCTRIPVAEQKVLVFSAVPENGVFLQVKP
jgi:hypothetical protein